MSSLSEALNMFDGAFCINLDARTDRWDYQHEQFVKYGVDDTIQRLSAVNLREKYENTEYDVKDKLNFSRLGHIGCILSHIKAIKHAKEMGWRHVCVFEDDATFIDGKTEQAHESVQDLFKLDKWEVFYFGATYRHRMTRISDNLLRVNGGAYATHAICYNEAVYDKLLNNISDDFERLFDIKSIGSNVVAVDVMLVKLLHPHLSFASDPMVAVQRDDYSDISIRTTPGMTDMQTKFFNNHRPH